NYDLFERSIAIVVVEIGIEAIVSHEQIRPAVVVIIGGADGKILAFRLIDFRRHRYVGERAIAVVVIERVRTAPIDARRTTAKHAPQVAITFIAKRHVTADIKIETSVTVVIEISYTQARTEFFAVDRDTIIAFEVREFDARRRCDICELDRDGRRYLSVYGRKVAESVSRRCQHEHSKKQRGDSSCVPARTLVRLS